MLHAMFKVNDVYHSAMSFAVCLTTWSKVSHVELCFSDGIVLNTTPTDGVHYCSAEDQGYDRYHWIAIPLPWISYMQEKEIKQWSDEIVATQPSYDFLGAVLGKFLPKANDPNKYFCSELVSDAIAKYTPCVDYLTWYSPNQLWKKLALYLHENYPKYSQQWKFRHNSK